MQMCAGSCPETDRTCMLGATETKMQLVKTWTRSPDSCSSSQGTDFVILDLFNYLLHVFFLKFWKFLKAFESSSGT